MPHRFEMSFATRQEDRVAAARENIEFCDAMIRMVKESGGLPCESYELMLMRWAAAAVIRQDEWAQRSRRVG